MTTWVAFGLFAAGALTGWVLRSFLFGWDRDCCNPDHEEVSW